MKPLSIVIPNYNGAHLLRRNLPSVLHAAERYSPETRVIVVDDGSKDASIEVLRNEFPQVLTVVHETNRGFSEAVLTGVNSAQTDLLFILNSDVELHVGCLEKLEPYFVDDNTFSACPLMLDEDGSINRHSWNLRSFKRGYLKLVDWELEAARKSVLVRKLPTLYSSGGSMMVSKAKFLALGGFHPIFKPFYGEDFDLGIRAWYRGWPSYFEPRATLVHQSQGSIKDSVKRSRVKETRRRNRYLLEWIHVPLPRLLSSTLPQSLLQLLGELVLLDFVNLKGFAKAVRRLPQAVAARRELHVAPGCDIESVIQNILGASASSVNVRHGSGSSVL